MYSVSVANFRFEQPLPIGSLGFDSKSYLDTACTVFTEYY